MRQLTVPLSALIGATFIGACGGGAGDGGDWQGTVRDSAGVTVVSNTGSGAWSADEAWTLEEDLRIGTAAGEPAYQFGQIVGIDVDSDGRIYVMDQQASEVRVFSPAGEFITSMGKPGGGPGELGQAAGPVFVGPGDTVSVPDFGQQRITRFTRDGEPAGDHPLLMTGGIPVKWMETPRQELVHQSMIMAMPGQAAVEPKNLLLRRDRQTGSLDTLMVMPAGETMDFSGGQPRMKLFAPEPTWGILPDGRLVYGNNARYRMEIYDPEGELRRIVTRDHEPRLISDRDEQEFTRVIREAWERAGMPPQAMDMMSQALSFAEYYPAFVGVYGGPEGTMWVQGAQSPEAVLEGGATFDLQDIGGPDWDVFDSEGRFLGVVHMPERFMPLLFKDDFIYGVFRDELDIQYVTRMRVHHGAGATDVAAE